MAFQDYLVNNRYLQTLVSWKGQPLLWTDDDFPSEVIGTKLLILDYSKGIFIDPPHLRTKRDLSDVSRSIHLVPLRKNFVVFTAESTRARRRNNTYEIPGYIVVGLFKKIGWVALVPIHVPVSVLPGRLAKQVLFP